VKFMDRLVALWKRMTCKHEWEPEGFADWVCRKCGATL